MLHPSCIARNWFNTRMMCVIRKFQARPKNYR